LDDLIPEPFDPGCAKEGRIHTRQNSPEKNKGRKNFFICVDFGMVHWREGIV